MIKKGAKSINNISYKIKEGGLLFHKIPRITRDNAGKCMFLHKKRCLNI